MSSSYGEYLRRKVAALPKVYGPSKYGDESVRTSVVRYRNSKPPLPTITASTTPNCSQGLHWHSTDFKVPTGGPYNGRNGDGQQQEWSVDGLIASRVCCAPLSGTITVPCCTPDRPSGIYYDAAGLSLTRGYQGATPSCCGYQSTLSTIPSNRSCCVNPVTRQDTLAADDMPRSPLPYPPATKACCHYDFKECPDPCCDEHTT